MKNFHYSLLCFGLAALVSAGCSDAPVEVTSSLAAAEIVNTKCPIMGHDIDAADIDPSLLKDWNGKKVAFCCPPCLEEWDELTEAEKAEKIAHPPGDHDDHGTHAEDAPAGEAATAPQPAAVENPAPATP